MIHDIIVAALILIGSGFVLLSAIGLVRLDDVYSRMHATAKAGTLGAGIILFAAAVGFYDGKVAVKAAIAIFFVLITAPVSSHLFSRAALKYGARERSSVNMLSGRYQSPGEMPEGIEAFNREQAEKRAAQEAAAAAAVAPAPVKKTARKATKPAARKTAKTAKPRKA